MRSRFRRSFDNHRLLWYGLAGVVVIVLLVLGVTAIGEADIGKKTYSADFAQAGGIRSGDAVRVAGIDVGKVASTELQGNRVHITMRVDRDVDVTANGSAEIKLSTLLGQRYIDISLGNSPDPAHDGVITETRVPYDLQKTIEKGTPILQGINDEQLGQSLRTLNQQLAGAPAVTRSTSWSSTPGR